jgi:hypothetical protein
MLRTIAGWEPVWILATQQPYLTTRLDPQVSGN